MGTARGHKWLHVRFYCVADLDVDVLDTVILEGLARDASVLLAELQPDHLPVLAHGMGPGHGAEAYIDSDLKNYISPIVSQLEK